MNIWDYEEQLFKGVTGLEDFFGRFDKIDSIFKSSLIELLIKRAEEDIHMPSMIASALVGDFAAASSCIVAYDNEEYPHDIRIVGTLPKGYTLTIKATED